MIPAVLGGRVRITGTTVAGRWQSWNSRTDAARVIDDDDVVHHTVYAKLRGEPTVFTVTDSVVRKGDMPVVVNIGRVMTVHPHALTVFYPDGRLATHPTGDWVSSDTESRVQVVRSGDRVELAPEWQGGQPAREQLTTEEKNIREFERVADLRVEGESVEQDVDDEEETGGYMRPCHACGGEGSRKDPHDGYIKTCEVCEGTGIYDDADDDAVGTPFMASDAALADHSADAGDMVTPAFDLNTLKPGDAIKIGDAEYRVDAVESAGVKTSFLSDVTHERTEGYLTQATIAEASAAGRLEVRPAPELPAETELPPGEPEPDAVERIMNADASAPAPKTPEEINKLKRQWLHDPIWDIEKTEGFEAHEHELRVWSDEQRAEWKKAAPPTNDDLANIIDMLRRRIAKLEDDHADALQLIAATAQRPAAPAAIEVTTLWQDYMQDPLRRDTHDAEIQMMRSLGWVVVSEETHIYPFVRIERGERFDETNATRIIRLERPAATSSDGARAAAAAAQPMPTRTTATHIQAPGEVSAATLLGKERQPIGPGRMTILPPERSADGVQRTLDALNAEVWQAAENAVAKFRATNPPPTFTPFPSALPAGQ